MVLLYSTMILLFLLSFFINPIIRDKLWCQYCFLICNHGNRVPIWLILICNPTTMATSNRLVLKTSAVSQTEFQSAIFEFMAKSIPINLKALWVVIEKNKRYFHLHCIGFIFFNVSQCYGRNREKPLISEKYSNAGPLQILHIIGLDLRFLVLSYHYLKFQNLNTSKNLMINSRVRLKVNTGASH